MSRMNTFGRHFRCTTFGESHGKAIGVVVDGCPPMIPLEIGDIQPFLERRRPGRSPLVSQRLEEDRVEILSGIFDGKTTGAPIAMLVWNRDVRSSDYEELREVFRPGHADYTWLARYGIRDHRGGGRSSGRETVGRVAAGAVAMKCLSLRGIAIESRIVSIHGATEQQAMEREIIEARDRGDSVGGIVEIRVKGCPPGIGDPVFDKLDARIAYALMGIGGVKGVEIGEGFNAAFLYGSQNNDQMDASGYLSNHAGGILGGISNGNEIVARIAVKPTPSISLPQRTLDSQGIEREIRIGGRHDPCIVPRVAPVAEAMVALVLIDALLERDACEGFRSNAR